MLRRSAGVANIARGEIIEEATRADALAAGHLRCAYLDVFNTEPLPQESPLWDLPNVLISPHSGDRVVGWLETAVEVFLGNFDHFEKGEELMNIRMPAV